MRNYFSTQIVKFHGHGDDGHGSILNGDFYAVGKDHDQLLFNVRAAEAAQEAALPAYTWTWSFPMEPHTVYWKLNATNFATILNTQAQGIFLNTRLNTDPLTPAPLLTDISALKEEGSPRNTFPTDEGTDGQRLRDGQTAAAGFALNYIGKLFFLTSNPAFKSLFDSLKAGKISSAKALASAKAIVQSR